MATTQTYGWGSPIFTGSSYYTAQMGAAASGPPVAAIAGTVAVTNGSATVTGTSTTFTTSLVVGQKLQFAADATYTPYSIASIASDTSLTLTANYTGTTSASTTATQYVANGICPLEAFFHVGVQAQASGGASIGVYARSGTAGKLYYSYDGGQTWTQLTLTADSLWHVVALPSWPATQPVDLWLRTALINSLSEEICFNGDQFLTLTDAATPSIAAVPAIGYGPPGTVSVARVPQSPGLVDAEGYTQIATLGASRAPWAQLGNSDAKFRFRATCTDIWANIYTSASSEWVELAIDGIPQGTSQSPHGKVSLRSDSIGFWYHLASGLDGTKAHDYTINWGNGGIWTQSVAVSGTFADAVNGRKGICWLPGDSIAMAYNNPTEGIGYHIAESGNYSVVNTGVFGALVQTGYAASPWPISLQQAATQIGTLSPFAFRPDVIVGNGGYNDAVHDMGNYPAEQTHTQANFESTLQAMLQAWRAACPTSKIVFWNIPPTSNLNATYRTNYNNAIASVISGLGDANTVLADVSNLTGYLTAYGITGTATISGGAVASIAASYPNATGWTNGMTPTVSIVGDGTGASFTASYNAGVLTFTQVSGGSGYTWADVTVSDTYDGTHPNYNGYNKMWSQVIGALVPAYSVGGSGIPSIFSGGLVR